MKKLSVWLYNKSGRFIAELQDVNGDSAGATGQGESEIAALTNLTTVIARMPEARLTELFAPIRETQALSA